MENEKHKMIIRIQDQLAKEFGCQAEDFQTRDNCLVTPVLHPKRRRFSKDTMPFFKMATFGGNTVISADSKLHPFIKTQLLSKEGHQLFELPVMREIDAALLPHRQQLVGNFHMFLPFSKTTLKPNTCKLQWFEQEELQPLYDTGHFPNALCPQFLPERPDMLAVAAIDNNKIIALAGCSADMPELWQIGIDVLPGYRGFGLGSYLVSQLKLEILHRGKLPYYGAAPANYHSWNIALNSGFFPAWVETTAECLNNKT